MLAVSSAAATVLTGNDQAVDYRVTLSLPAVASAYNDATLSATSVSIDASMTTDVPAGTRLKAGYPAMQAQFTLAGLVDSTDETKTAAWLFGRYSTTSPLYRSDAFRCPVTIDIGVYTPTSAGTPEWVRKFTGYVDEYTVGSDGSVQFTCLDRRSDLQPIAALPPAYTANNPSLLLTSEFVIDAVLRAASKQTVLTWPKQRPSCVLAAGMRGSQWPEVGTFTSATGGFAHTGGRFGTAIFGTQPSGGTLTYQTATPVNTSFHLEQWVTNPDPSVITIQDVGSSSSAVITFGTSSLTVQINGPSATTDSYTFTTALWSTSGVHYVAVDVAWTGPTWSAKLTVDATTTSSGTRTTGPAVPLNGQLASRVTYALAAGTVIEAVQVTNETGTVASNNGFTSTAVLDPSLNNLLVVPSISTGTDAWSVLQQIADAELAVLGFDESGVFRSKNRNTIAAQSVARAITSAAALKAAGVKSSQASVVNRAQVGYTGYTFASTASTLYAADSIVKIPAGATIKLPVTLSSAAYGIASAISIAANGAITDGVNQARFSIDAAGSAETTAVTATVTQTAPDKATITLVSSGRTAYAVSPANYTDITVGTPLLQIGGKTITPNNEVTADYQYPPAANGGAASTRFGEVPFSQTGNPWMQDGDTAMQLAEDIVNGAAVPRPDLENLDIVPDPRLQIADRVHIQDPDVTGIDEYGVIFGWNLSVSPDQYAMTLDVRTDAAPGGWLVGVAGRSEIGAGSSTSGATAYIYPAT